MASFPLSTINQDCEFLAAWPSGCGTVLRLIAGLESVDNGHIHLVQARSPKSHVKPSFRRYALLS
jgi:spermidine/putrescine transport system ATP-binding protein